MVKIKVYPTMTHMYNDIEKQQVMDSRDNYSQYKDTLDSDLYSLLENNPYKDLYYDPGFWDNIGLSDKASDTNAQYQQLYNEYIANILQKQSERDWNSPLNQASLERQAGLNPDLTGISGTAVSDFDEVSGAIPQSLNGQSPAISSVQSIGSILSFALNAYQGITSTIANVESLDLQNVGKLKELAMPFVTDSFAQAFLGSDDSDYNLNESASVMRNDFIKTLPRKYRKRGEDAFNSLLQSMEIQTKGYEKYAENFEKEYKAEAISFFKSKDNGYFISKFLQDNVDLSLKAYELSKRTDISRLKKERYLDKLRLNQMKYYQKESENGNLLASLLMLGMIESQTIPVLGNMANTALHGGIDIVKNLTNPLSWIKRKPKVSKLK